MPEPAFSDYNAPAKMATDVIHLETEAQIPAAAGAGAKALKAGKLVGFATETVYGLGALATSAQAMRRLRELKSRPSGPFTVHVAAVEDAARYVTEVPEAARRLMAKGWPGPVTLLLPAGGAGGKAPSAFRRKRKAIDLRAELCHDGVIGLRCPDVPVARAMLAAVPGPVVAPSANPAGQRPPQTAEQVMAWLDGKIDLLIDSGRAKLGRGSTIVQFDPSGWRIVRKGPYDERDVRRLMRRRLLLVCTGNTCRSPLAAGLAKKVLAQRLGCRVGELRGKGIEVRSAGVFAAAGSRATVKAIRAARGRGVDISRHRSRKLTAELIDSSDVIFCMTGNHVGDVRYLSPSAGDRARTVLAAGDIPDPIGGGQDVYDRTAKCIERALENRLDEEMP